MANDHEPVLERLPISGAQFVRSPVVRYNSSVLVEAHRAGWNGLYADAIDHLYWIVTGRGVVRKWGRHEYTTDRYSVVLGTLEVALFDGRDDSETSGHLHVVRLEASSGDGLLIPPGVWHNFRAVSDEVVLLNSKTPPYNPRQVDKELLPMPNEMIDFVWERDGEPLPPQ